MLNENSTEAPVPYSKFAKTMHWGFVLLFAYGVFKQVDNFDLALLWILIRFIYIPVYILGLKYFRTFIWMISFLILILMGIKFI